jgi:4-carboxymuconolactone decarboxylase
MSRVPKIDPATFSPEQHRLYDAMIASRPDGKLQGPSTMWIRNAGLAAVTGQMAKLLRYEGKLEATLFEMITLIVARQWTAHYVWSVHAKEATRVGLEPEIVVAVRTRRIPPFSNERQKIVYEITNELVETKVISDGAYIRAQEEFGLDLLLEIVTAVGFYTLICMTIKTFEVPAPGDATPLE